MSTDDYYDDDAYDDGYDDAYHDYVPNTNGSQSIFVVTLIYCVVSVLIVPPLVVLGAQYERFRREKQLRWNDEAANALADGDGGVEGDVTHEGTYDEDDEDEDDEEDEQRYIPRSQTESAELDVEVTIDGGPSVESSPTDQQQQQRLLHRRERSGGSSYAPSKVSFAKGTHYTPEKQPQQEQQNGQAKRRRSKRRQQRARSTTGRSTYSTAKSATSGMTNRTAATGRMIADTVEAAVLDKLLIPTYPDPKEVTARRRPAAARSTTGVSAVSHSSVPYSHFTGMSSNRPYSVLDYGATSGSTLTGGRHRRHANGKTAGIHPARLRRMLDEEKALLVKQTQSRSLLRDGEGIADENDRRTELNYQRSQLGGGGRSAVAGSALRGGGGGGGGPASAIGSALSSRMFGGGRGTVVVDDISPDDAADADDPGIKPAFSESDHVPSLLHNSAKDGEYYDGDRDELSLCCGPRPMWSPGEWLRSFNTIVYLAEMDVENKRILTLAAPLVSSEIMEAIFDNVTVAIIGKFLGVDAVAAYAIVEVIVGFSDEFIHGLTEAFEVVGGHAIGAKNYYLAGQYVQICSIMYVIWSIPILGVWYFTIDHVIRAFGLGDDIAQMGLDYTRVVVFHYMLEGVAAAVDVLFDLTGHEKFGSAMEVLEGLVDLFLSILAVTLYDKTDLVTIGWIHLTVGFAFYVICWLVAVQYDWFDKYYDGMLKSFALRNTRAVKILFSTAVPIAFGSLLSYGEWEVLTIVVTKIGPIEVSAWAIMGSLWETFEAATEGIVGAASIRVAFHLGRGSGFMAKISAFKSLLLGCIFAWILTAAFFIMGDSLPAWFTDDPILQHLLSDMIPLVGIGNVTMTFGMMSWTIIGAQGRVKLATVIATITSWGITLPLACILVLGLDFGIESVVASVVIGYATTGSVLSYVLLRSDWDRIASIIHELNKSGEYEWAESDEESEDDGSASSASCRSSSSSSSSDSSSDDDSYSENPYSENMFTVKAPNRR